MQSGNSSWTRGLVPVNDTELWVERAGSGPLLMTLHGGLGFDHTYLRPWLDPLARSTELVYFDLRGQGRSRRLPPDAWSTTSLATFVADIDALRAALGSERMVLLGTSFGAYLALEYALAHNERLDALILCSAGADFAHGATIAQNAIARGGALGEAFLGAISSPIPDDNYFAFRFPSFLPLYFHGSVPPGFMADTRYSAAAANFGFAELAGWSVRARLGEIRTPTLVIVGDDDFITPRSPCADELLSGLPAARLDVVPASGHFPYAENAAHVLDSVTRFLADHVRG